MVVFCQVVLGPPGAGKSTYCSAMTQLLEQVKRPCAIVNLDPAAGVVGEKCLVDIRELISVEEVMERLKLGPNGALLYCMEFLEKNLDWLQKSLQPLEKKGLYLLFDLPGQVELFTVHGSLRRILKKLVGWDYRLTTVHLVDCIHCSDHFKFLSILLLSLSTMLHVDTPHVNVLSKVDLLEKHHTAPPFGLSFYTDVTDLAELGAALQDEESEGNSLFAKRHRGLTSALCELVEDYSHVQFTPLTVTDRASVLSVLKIVDKAHGYADSAHEKAAATMLWSAAAVGRPFDFERGVPLDEEEEEKKQSG